MLPPGHAAAGLLVAYALLQTTSHQFSGVQVSTLLATGAFFGFAPDLDMFYAFLKARGFTIPGRNINHRAYLTHRPFVWLIAGIAVMIFAQTEFWQYFGLLVWLGSWSHFVLDSHFVGVMWLWPFTKKFYAMKSPGHKEDNTAKGFLNYWLTFLTQIYPKKTAPTFYTEILILLVTASILLK